MQTEKIYIQEIPAIIWGNTSDKVCLCIHGQGGCKEEAGAFAQIADSYSWQVLSIDLPGHGERINEKDHFDPWHTAPELLSILEYARKHWTSLALFANSIGAWFSMLAFEKETFSHGLFVSPVLNMENLILNMMSLSNVSENRLRSELIIPTSFGQTLSWEYLEYVREHPVEQWTTPTYILYGENDNLTGRGIVDSFVRKFNCKLTVMKNGEHWFHTQQQLDVLYGWIKDCFKGKSVWF
jgi:pimeloyl-ACP methyl ester carboxylesterase